MEQGIRYERLTTLGECELRPAGRKYNWYEKCICDCGSIVRVNRYQLKKEGSKGRGVKSCGCLRREVGLENVRKAIKAHTKHGMCVSRNNKVVKKKNISNDNRFYQIYTGILKRCNNEKSKSYKWYGGRGIKCQRPTFEDFMNDMYESYLEHIKYYGNDTSIDRIDVNGNYCKCNCRWATSKEQGANKRHNVKYYWDGYYMTIREILDYENIDMDPRIVWWRLKKGWDLDEAVFTDSTLYHDKSRHGKSI